MKILESIKKRWADIEYPFLIHSHGELRFSEISKQKDLELKDIKSGDVVALIGDFDPKSIITMLQLLDKDVILVPLTKETKSQHQYFFKSAFVDFVIEKDTIKHFKHTQKHELIEKLKKKNHAGLVFFFNWYHRTS